MENMTLIRANHVPLPEATEYAEDTVSTERVFIQANTQAGTLEDIRNNHVIPVFVKDNEPLISQADFIETVMEVVSQSYYGERILKPSIRLSHPIKGRIPDAKDKPASQLQDWEKTVYYERMMFVIEIPSITDDVDGNEVTFTIGGVKSYGEDNLYNKKGSEEHFKVFAGFQNRVCTNLSVWSDGLAPDIRVKTISELRSTILNMLLAFNPVGQIRRMHSLVDSVLSEQQFAQLIGRCRMFQFLPLNAKRGIEPLLFGDQQISNICKDYYRDNSFCRSEDGSINLWKLYNLFTGANKTTYIDQFLERSVCASHLVEVIRDSLNKTRCSWFLN
jgi:Domain of unknown function, B. Theta Gene description (DUF3871)